MKEAKAEDLEHIQSAIIPPTALDIVSNPVAIGANGDPVSSTNNQLMKEAKAEGSEHMQSRAIPPTALNTVSNPTAVGANEESMSSTNDPDQPSVTAIVASSVRKKAVDEYR